MRQQQGPQLGGDKIDLNCECQPINLLLLALTGMDLFSRYVRRCVVMDVRFGEDLQTNLKNDTLPPAGTFLSLSAYILNYLISMTNIVRCTPALQLAACSLGTACSLCRAFRQLCLKV